MGVRTPSVAHATPDGRFGLLLEWSAVANARRGARVLTRT